MTSVIGWDGNHTPGQRPQGIHPWALVGAPPESREWKVGDPTFAPQIPFSALVDAFCTVDAGTTRPTTLGERTWLQKRVHVGHDTIVGDDCEICVGVTLCGWVEIGDGVRIGGNTWIKPRVKIGDGAVIGGGSVVTKDVPPDEVWAGNPARYMKNAWTHPSEKPLYVPVKGQIRARPYIEGVAHREFPSVDDIAEHMGYGARELEREAAQSGVFRPPADAPHPDWLRGVT